MPPAPRPSPQTTDSCRKIVIDEPSVLPQNPCYAPLRGLIVVRLTVMHLPFATILFVLFGLAGCASTRAPEMPGSVWSGQDAQRLKAELRFTSNSLPEGWIFEAPRSTALGSFAYRKRSGTYDYSEHGYFAVDAHWRAEQVYVGLLEPEGIFCVVNPEMQADVTGDTVTTYRVYDFCVQLHRR
jgi:hypothetical protein